METSGKAIVAKSWGERSKVPLSIKWVKTVYKVMALWLPGFTTSPRMLTCKHHNTSNRHHSLSQNEPPYPRPNPGPPLLPSTTKVGPRQASTENPFSSEPDLEPDTHKFLPDFQETGRKGHLGPCEAWTQSQCPFTQQPYGCDQDLAQGG